jgi:hypothetical protein
MSSEVPIEIEDKPTAVGIMRDAWYYVEQS